MKLLTIKFQGNLSDGSRVGTWRKDLGAHTAKLIGTFSEQSNVPASE
jgi:hypothetical protein